jgi:hypothetical protein
MLFRGFRAAAAAAAFAALPLGLGAQEAAADSFGSFFGGDASGGAESSDSSSPGAVAASALAIGGSVGLDIRAYLDEDALDAVSRDEEAADATETVPSVKLDLSYKGASTEFVANLKLSESILEDDPVDVVQEAYARLYAGDFVLETGKMKLVWGKGDELHVVDLFNANDYTDFIFPDYADRRLAEPMVHLAWNTASGLRAEAVWTPTMTADRIPTSGYWAPARALSLAALVESYATYQGVQTYAATYQSVYAAQLGAGAPASAAAVAASAAASLAQTAYLSDHSEAAAFLPDTDQLDFGQYGLRLTGTAGSLDWGLSYYLGHFKTPSAQVSYDAATGYVSDLSLSYDRLQSFGLEGGMVVGPVNFRAEAAYYLTDDAKGDDPAVANNSLNWVFGFDVGLPVHNASINIQTVGKYVLGSDKIDSTADVDWDADEVYANDKLVVRLADNWLREKLQAEVKLVWGIERGDVVVMPSLEWNAADDLFFALSGAFFPGADDGEFASFSDNRFVKLSATYKF